MQRMGGRPGRRDRGCSWLAVHALGPQLEGQPLAWGRELEGLWPPAAGRSRGSGRRPWSCGQLCTAVWPGAAGGGPA
ncbi:hypothetical protein BDA96_02G089000 [Sorghum bicolor]|uniref:Uncharacterized protein n=2 Tax=Sorghum bicolor TaxID=4558 RepID=A0A921US45_SORBI|nr:hypothetical protein BDA96_02G089000 [Sorghum bicolor]KXG34748.1 hypothetical protein SORBI_3002G085600 [Sorghum bicolor]